MLVTVDVAGICSNIPHDLGSQSLREGLNETGICKVDTEEIIQIVEFALKNKYFEFNESICRLLELNLHRLTFHE